MNASAKSVAGLSNVVLKVGAWEGSCSLTMLPLDDFDLMLGNEFLLSIKAAVIPYLGGVMINNPRCPSFEKESYADQVKEEEK